MLIFELAYETILSVSNVLSTIQTNKHMLFCGPNSSVSVIYLYQKLGAKAFWFPVGLLGKGSLTFERKKILWEDCLFLSSHSMVLLSDH